MFPRRIQVTVTQRLDVIQEHSFIIDFDKNMRKTEILLNKVQPNLLNIVPNS